MKKIIMLLLAIFLLVGCDDTKPTYRDLENQLQEQKWMYENKLDELRSKHLEDAEELQARVNALEEENGIMYSYIEYYENVINDLGLESDFGWYVIGDEDYPGYTY